MVIKYPQVGDKASLAYMAVDLAAKLARRGEWGVGGAVIGDWRFVIG